MNSQRINEVGDKVMESIKSHPVITACVGLGVSWFLTSNLFKQKTSSEKMRAQLQRQASQLQEEAKQYAEYKIPELKESVKEAGNVIARKSQSVMEGVSDYMDEKIPQLKQSANETREMMVRKSQSVLESVSEYAEDNPLVTGFIGLSAGLILGILTSGVLKGNGILEETRQAVQNKTKQILNETKEKAGQVIGAAGKAARDEAERRNVISH